MQVDGTADAQIHLHVRCAAELVERRGLAVDGDALGAVGGGDGDGARAFQLRERGQLDAAGQVRRAGQHKAMANVLARGSVVSGGKGVIRIADAVDVIKELAENASPGLRLGQRVVRRQLEAVCECAVEVQQQRVIGRAVVRAEDRGIGIGIGAIAVIALLVRVVGAEHPVAGQRALHSGGGVDGIRRLVVGINQRRRRHGVQVHRLEGRGPAILCQVVVEDAEAGAQHGAFAAIRRVNHSKARTELMAIIVRNGLGVAERRQQ